MKMKNIGLVTINDNNNYGNKLQNYAVQEKIRQLNYWCTTIKNDPYLNRKKYIYIRSFIFQLKKIKRMLKQNRRKKLFLKFDENIKFSKNYFYWILKKNIN